MSKVVPDTVIQQHLDTIKEEVQSNTAFVEDRFALETLPVKSLIAYMRTLVAHVVALEITQKALIELLEATPEDLGEVSPSRALN